jgi:phosphohistidine phosphatase SixA
MTGRMLGFFGGAALAVMAAASGAVAQTPAAPAAPAAAATPAPRPMPVATLENRNMESGPLMTRLKAGGLIILMRHERTEVPSRDDDYSRPLSDCMAQRNLSVAGYAGSMETGVALRTIGVPIGHVLSSPMCRSMDTARLMFQRVEPEMRLLHHDNTPERTVTVSGTELNALLADLPVSADNHVLVSHIGNIYFATGIRVSEGEFVVLERKPEGGFIALGKVDPGYIGAHARYALYQAERARAAEADEDDDES